MKNYISHTTLLYRSSEARPVTLYTTYVDEAPVYEVNTSSNYKNTEKKFKRKTLKRNSFSFRVIKLKQDLMVLVYRKTLHQ